MESHNGTAVLLLDEARIFLSNIDEAIPMTLYDGGRWKYDSNDGAASYNIKKTHLMLCGFTQTKVALDSFNKSKIHF